jgi:anaerobic selenocysteine-containing dehydrogenase
MGERKEIHTFCGVCAINCAHVAVVEDGKLVAVKPDRESDYRHDICPGAKGPLTLVGVENHPDRLKYPLKRVGKRGEGKWERISWDEALDTVAQKFLDLKEKHGPESLAVCLGEPKNMETIAAHRFATAFGTPNVPTPGGLCGIARVWAASYTYGRPTMPDVPEKYTEGSPLPKLYIEWGCDSTHFPGRHFIKTYTDHGVKIVVIDPMKITSARKAELWIRPRPGSDGALAMGMLKVIIEEDLYDKDFVARWTTGFEEIRKEVKRFSLDDVEGLTWVPKDQVIELARLYATTKPAVLADGNAIECMKNAFDIFRVFCIMRAITGNLNVPGGEVFLTPPPHTRPGRMMLLSALGRNVDRAIGNEFKAAMRAAYVPFQSLTKAGAEGKPYPIKAAICCLTNPLLSYPDSEATYKAFMNMDFIVVLELFHTPTTAIADIVLPAAWSWEEDTIGYWAGWFEEIRAYRKVVDPPGEAWSDLKIFNELGKRIGLEKYFWDDDTEALDEYLKAEGGGISFQELQKLRRLDPKKEYKQPEEEPYRTPSGKVEIRSRIMEEDGYDPFPRWEALSRLPGELSEEYPLLLSNAKSHTYMLSGFKMVDRLRKREPLPVVRLNPQTAQDLGLEDGEWVFIETNKGRITQKLSLDPDLNPRVAMAAWGWWFPEEGPDTMYGWRKSNYNILTGYEDPGQPCGAPDLKGIPCRVYKA